MKRNPWIIVLILYIIFIFGNSLTPADASSRQSGFALMLVRNMLEATGLGDIGITEHIIRKLAHFTEYMGFGILLFPCLNRYRFKGMERLLITMILVFLIPFVDETLQLFTPGRSGQISDVWLDVSGAAVGTMIAFWCSRIERRDFGKRKRGYSVGKKY